MEVNYVLENILNPTVEDLKDSIENLKFPIERDRVLFGGSEGIDSLELVTFLVAVEEKIDEVTNKSVRLVSEKAMSRKSSPFSTYGTLIDYIIESVEEAQGES